MIAHQERAEKLVEIYRLLQKEFRGQYKLTKIFAAQVHLMNDQDLDVETIRQMRQKIRKQVGVFSPFRGNNEFPLAVIMACDEDGDDLWQRLQQNFEQLRSAGFKKSPYLPLAALVLAQSKQTRSLPELMQRMHELYRGFRNLSFWRTGQEDLVTAALLATGDRPVDEMLLDVSRFCKDLKDQGLPKGGLQNLAQILALGEETYEIRQDRAAILHRRLKEQKYRLRRHQLPYLGVMTLLSTQPEKLVQEAIMVERFLHGQKGFGSFSLDRSSRLVLAASVVDLQILDDQQKLHQQGFLASSLQTILIAQQAAMIAAVASSSAAAAAAGSS